MSATILKGMASDLIEEPQAAWKERLARAPGEFRQILRFMSEEHHRVRYYVVEELPRCGRPLAPEAIGRALGLPAARTEAILEDLEKNLFFLVRNEEGAVSWAFPVTVTETPHHLRFSTGERLDAA
jgi:hypothetical protein